MASSLLFFWFCQGLFSVITLGAPLETKINGKPADVEETDLLHLKPSMGRFLENPENLENYENSVTIPKSPVGEFIRNDEEMEVEDEESLNDLLKTVLITLRDHPDIIMDILQEEDRKNKDFQRPSAQLNSEPKRIEKKGGNMYKAMGYPSEESNSSQESQEDSESRDGSYYKNKYDKSSKSSEESDESKGVDLAQYYKQKYANSKEDDKSRSSSSSSSSSSSEESKQSELPLDKRVPEQPEETIDITSLPDDGDIDLTKIISEGGLEDLPEYKEKVKFQKPSNLLTSDGTIFLGKIPKSGKPNGKSAKPKPSALKPVITEADMSESKMEDNRESGSEHKTGANEKTEKSASQQTPQDGS